MTDAVVEAMKAGAGLPVLSPLDRYLETRGLQREQAPPERDVVHQVLDAARTWIGSVAERTRERLDACDDGPLAERLDHHVDAILGEARTRIAEVRAATRASDVPWTPLSELLADLHGVRTDLQHVQRAAGHLAELARLVDDVPADESGRSALDDLAAREAEAAAHDDPALWAQAARDLEAMALDAVRPGAPDGGTTADRGDAPSPVVTDPVPITIQLDGDRSDNGHGPGDAPTVEPDATAGTNGLNGSNGTIEHPTTVPRTGHDHPAGPEVLAEWDAHGLPGDLRHAPFWAPILEGDIVPGEGTPDELVQHARRVEVDLVDLELPRVLAIPTGADPATVRQRIAERAAEITRRDPDRPAREAFLDHVTGKMPKRYRETSHGLTLLASIAHAICTDDPWDGGGPDYHATIRSMIAHELERTPAVDVGELATSLVGPSASARATVEQAARELSTDHDDVTFHQEGILVRAIAAREDPDALYDLKESLKRRLSPERAEQLVTALITTGEENP